MISTYATNRGDEHAFRIRMDLKYWNIHYSESRYRITQSEPDFTIFDMDLKYWNTHYSESRSQNKTKSEPDFTFFDMVNPTVKAIFYFKVIHLLIVKYLCRRSLESG